VSDLPNTSLTKASLPCPGVVQTLHWEGVRGTLAADGRFGNNVLQEGDRERAFERHVADLTKARVQGYLRAHIVGGGRQRAGGSCRVYLCPVEPTTPKGRVQRGLAGVWLAFTASLFSCSRRPSLLLRTGRGASFPTTARGHRDDDGIALGGRQKSNQARPAVCAPGRMGTGSPPIPSSSSPFPSVMRK